MSERDVSRRLGPVEVLIVAFVCLFFLALAPVACRKSRFGAYSSGVRLVSCKSTGVVGVGVFSK